VGEDIAVALDRLGRSAWPRRLLWGALCGAAAGALVGGMAGFAVFTLGPISELRGLSLLLGLLPVVLMPILGLWLFARRLRNAPLALILGLWLGLIAAVAIYPLLDHEGRYAILLPDGSTRPTTYAEALTDSLLITVYAATIGGGVGAVLGLAGGLVAGLILDLRPAAEWPWAGALLAAIFAGVVAIALVVGGTRDAPGSLLRSGAFREGLTVLGILGSPAPLAGWLAQVWYRRALGRMAQRTRDYGIVTEN
jgi:hypothetical protein